MQTLRPRVERIVGEIVAPSVDFRRIIAAQEPRVAHYHQHQANGGTHPGEPREKAQLPPPAHPSLYGTVLPFTHHYEHQHHKIDNVAQLAGVGPKVGVDKFRTLLRVGFHQHGECLLRDAHFKIEHQKVGNAHQEPKCEVEQRFHRHFRPSVFHQTNQPCRHPHHGKLNEQALEEA